MTVGCTRDAADDLVLVRDLASRLDVAVHRENAEPTVHVPTIVQPRNGLLSRIAALGEADRPLRQPGFGG